MGADGSATSPQRRNRCHRQRRSPPRRRCWYRRVAVSLTGSERRRGIASCRVPPHTPTETRIGREECDTGAPQAPSARRTRLYSVISESIVCTASTIAKVAADAVGKEANCARCSASCRSKRGSTRAPGWRERLDGHRRTARSRRVSTMLRAADTGAVGGGASWSQRTRRVTLIGRRGRLPGLAPLRYGCDRRWPVAQHLGACRGSVGAPIMTGPGTGRCRSRPRAPPGFEKPRSQGARRRRRFACSPSR
jgi:hypothetical protein